MPTIEELTDPNRLRELLKPDPPKFINVPRDQIYYSKKARIIDRLKTDNLPAAYRSNTAKEETVLEYVEDFRRQFVYLFPDRSPLLLTPFNECAVRKFVCTSIRPTLLPYQELQSLQACALFVADFLEYLPLDDPVSLPDILPSLTTILATRAGDSLDFAVFLCSLLRGAGYDAYVCTGFAPRAVTTMDLSGVECPYLTNEATFEAGSDKWWDFDIYNETTQNELKNSKLLSELIAGAGSLLGPQLAAKHIARKQAQSGQGAQPAASAAAAAAAAAAEASATRSKATDALESLLASAGGAPAGGDGGAAAVGAAVRLDAVLPRGQYTVEPPPTHASKFLERMEFERRGVAKLKARDTEAARKAAEKVIEDVIEGDRVHSWVLVRKGRRGVTQDVFVEPSTAAIRPVGNCPYTAIESVFNERNYWVNMQGGDTKPSDMSFDLSNGSAWEFVIIQDRPARDGTSSAQLFSLLWNHLHATPPSAAAAANAASSAVSAAANANAVGGPGAGAAGDGPGDGRAGSGATPGSSAALPDSSDMAAATAALTGVSLGDAQVVEVPHSWVEPIVIDRDTYRDRFPAQKRIISYRDCSVEKYSEYHEGMQGLVLQVSIFEASEDAAASAGGRDIQNEFAKEVRSDFKHRADKLTRRVTYPTEERVHEFYARGRDGGLMELIQVSNRTRVFKFYPRSRVDCLVMRMEHMGSKVVELYEDAPDRLVYRSITVEPQSLQQAPRNARGARPVTIALGRGNELPVRKITEKFARNPAVSAEKDVRKRTHFLMEQLIRLDFHYGPNSIVHSVQVIDKEDKLDSRLLVGSALAAAGAAVAHASRSYEHRVAPDYVALPPGQCKIEVQALLARERWLINEVREREKRLADLVQRLEHEKHDTTLVQSVYTKAKEMVERGDDLSNTRAQNGGRGDEEKTSTDFLSAFLVGFPSDKPLTKEQAQQVKDCCLAALKERLLERANIIQAHLDNEYQRLYQAQMQFKRSMGNGAAGKDRELSSFFESTMFKIDILKTRLRLHEESALAKYVSLDQKLNQHPKLQALWADDGALRGRSH
jgi:hypothetical protein